jgi:tRNA (mo5U34)-methyltransferase
MNISATPEQAETRRRIKELGQWFQNMTIDGVATAPDHFLGDYPTMKWKKFRDAVPADLQGRSVLDIGCNAGFYSLEMRRRNAGRVLGIDNDERYLRQARFAAARLGADVEFRRMSVYEIARLGERFDLVIFMGVLYHLRHPLLALDLIHEHVARDMLLFQSLQRGKEEVTPVKDDYPFPEQEVFNQPGYPRLHFVEKSFSKDPTNWFIPNRAAVEAMLRSSGFAIEQHPEREVYLCRKVARPAFVPPPPC